MLPSSCLFLAVFSFLFSPYTSMKHIILLLISFLCATTVFSQNSIVEEEFSVVNPLDSTVLNGTLTTPENAVPKAVIVLATGSGLQDRDETLGRHKPFRDLALYLTSNGYAVARTDDRGFGNPIDTALVERSTQWDEVSDYRAVMEAMHNHKSFNNIPVGILGHSLGGSEAIMCFSKSPKSLKYNSVGSSPDFVITLAAPAVSGDSVILDQTKQLMRLQGTEYAYENMKETLARRYSWAKSFMPEKSLRAALYEDVKSTLPPGVTINDQMKAMIESQLDVFCSPAYREMLRYNPAPDIAEVKVPWLALYGTKDIQVSVPFNSDALGRVAKNMPNISISILEDKNHLFQNAVTGSIEEYQTINGSFADDVLQEILEWLEFHFNQK